MLIIGAILSLAAGVVKRSGECEKEASPPAGSLRRDMSFCIGDYSVSSGCIRALTSMPFSFISMR